MRISVAITLLALMPALALGEVFRCDIRPDGTGDWIPKRLLIDHSSGHTKAEVWDPLIKYFVGSPMTARVVAENEERLTVAREITGLTNRAGRARQYTPALAFRATLFMPSLKLIIKSKPRGYPNDYRGVATCRVLIET